MIEPPNRDGFGYAILGLAIITSFMIVVLKALRER